jgi:choline dehydrogenase-like flavoprotein
MIFVVGSGPAGVSCAIALLRNGQKVTMLDAGIELEPSRQQLIKSMSCQQPDQWSASAVSALQEGNDVRSSGVALKKCYGSDYPYRQLDDSFLVESGNTRLRSSLAKGGFSNVWGAAILPYSASDIADWPITVDELAPYYRSVFSFMPLAAVQDDLENNFPLYSDHYFPLKASRQAQAFLDDLSNNKTELNAHGIIFGSSRLAVLPQNAYGDSCKTCGLCLYGCPYELIYNSSRTVDELMSNPNFCYKKDVVVTNFVERTDGVEIRGLSTVDKCPVLFNASSLYLAAGVLATTKIVLDSLAQYDRTFVLKDSQYFNLPLLRNKATAGAMEEDLHTLAQVFLEIVDEEISDKTIHLQIYSYNDFYKKAIENELRMFYPLFKPLIQPFLERLLIVQAYLPSDLSSKIKVKLAAPAASRPSQLILQGEPNFKTKAAINKVIDKLYRARHLLKATPLTPLLNIQPPGTGFHSGGTFPMKYSPVEFETDIFGRPYGLKNVYLVDATIFPSIPTTTITLAVMANAYRIGQQTGITA